MKPSSDFIDMHKSVNRRKERRVTQNKIMCNMVQMFGTCLSEILRKMSSGSGKCNISSAVMFVASCFYILLSLMNVKANNGPRK